MTSPFLSKSKYLSGLQCSKLLWHYYNAKDKFPPTDESTQAIFDQGHIVGKLAQTLFPGGIEVAGDGADFDTALQSTQKLLSQRKPLFEPGFRFKNAFARADILNPVGKNQWDIVEVKSSTSIKDINIYDLALQRYAYEGAGLQIHKCILMHINTEYVRKGEIDAEKLFIQADVTKEVDKILPQIESDLDKMLKVLAQKKSPDTPIGPHCSDPYGCPLIDMCWNYLPEDNPLTLYRMRKDKAFELINRGFTTITKLPREVKFNDKQRIQVGSTQTGKPFVDKKYIRVFLKQLQYPLYYLDFETINPTIPLFDNSSPFQQIPFQFSLHIHRVHDATLEHHGFLAEGGTDPRKDFLDQLKPLLGKEGSIIVYNGSFELGRLDELTTLFPSSRTWYNQIKRRTVDLLQPFRDFAYYHPSQNGSASIKAVLPALTGKGYEGMPIADGGTASREYLRVTYEEVSPEERMTVRKQLEEYCKLDTEAMVRIVEKLQSISK